MAENERLSYAMGQAFVCFLLPQPGVRMVPDKHAQVNAILITLQERWGPAIIQRGFPFPQTSAQALPTGFPALDEALEGGIPRGRITEILGMPTSGMTTLAYRLIAQAQAGGAFAIFIDPHGIFDTDYARGYGVVLERIFLARPDTHLHLFDLTRDLLTSGGVALITLDLGSARLPDQTLRRLIAPLLHSGCTIVLLRSLTSQAVSPASAAALRLHVARSSWIKRSGDIRGYWVTSTCLNPVDSSNVTSRRSRQGVDFGN